MALPLVSYFTPRRRAQSIPAHFGPIHHALSLASCHESFAASVFLGMFRYLLLWLLLPEPPILGTNFLQTEERSI